MNHSDIRTLHPSSRRLEEAPAAPAKANGWPSVKLGEVCQARMGETILSRDLHQTGVPVFSANTDERPWGFYRNQRLTFDSRSVVIGARGSIGFPRLPKEPQWTATQTTIVITCESTERVTPEWLFFSLRHYDFSGITSKQAIPMITVGDVEALKLALPSVADQRRIAGRLREQMAEVAQARTAVQAQLAAAQALPAALLRAHFTTPAALRWPREQIGELVVSPLRTGLSKSAKADSPWRCLGLSSVRDGNLIMDAAKPVDVTAREAEANRIRAGAFYVVRGNGNLRLVARGALAPQTVTEPILFPDLLIEVNPNTERLLPLYLRWVWDSAEVRTALEDRARTSAGIHKINLRNLAGVEIPLPPLPEQRTLAARLTAEMSTATALRASLQARLAEIERLPAALLRTAFSPAN